MKIAGLEKKQRKAFGRQEMGNKKLTVEVLSENLGHSHLSFATDSS